MGTGADSPATITHCFVLKGFDLVWSMLEGEKVFPGGDADLEPTGIRSKSIENRHTRFDSGYYGVILGKGTKGVTIERYTECKQKLPDMAIPPWDWKELKHYKGCVVGVVKVSHSLPYHLCKNSPWAIGPVCNIISEAGWLEKPIPCRGNLGACLIKDRFTLGLVRHYADRAMKEGVVFKTGGDVEYPFRGSEVWGRKRKGCVDLGDKDEVPRLADFLKDCHERLTKRARGDAAAEA